jgi:hypothetical protein
MFGARVGINRFNTPSHVWVKWVNSRQKVRKIESGEKWAKIGRNWMKVGKI